MLNPECPICGSGSKHSMTVPLDCKTFRPTPFGKIYSCNGCLLGFVLPRPLPSETSDFYALDAYYTQGKSHMPDTGKSGYLSKVRTHLAWRVDSGKPLMEIIRAHLAPPGMVVDIGCGGGNLLQAMSSLGYDVVGVERDAGSISVSSGQVSVLEGTAEFLPASLKKKRYDGVVFSHVIEHLVDPVVAMRSAASLLKPNGLLFCEVPNNESLISKKSAEAWEHLDIPRHINFFHRDSLHTLAKASGLKVVHTYFGGYNRYFSDSYIATEQRIFDRLVDSGWQPGRTRRNSVMRSWALLLKTAFMNSQRKYDSVGIVAALDG